MGSRDLERGAWPWSWVALLTPVEGVLDHIGNSNTRFVLEAVLGQDTEAAKELQNQLIAWVDWLHFQQERQSRLDWQ
jgi:hypothetical protein